MYDLLTSTAEVAVALAGFSGLFVAFSGRGRSLAAIERYALLFLLFASLAAALLAMLPFVLMAITGVDGFAPWFCLFPAVVLILLSWWISFSPLRRGVSRDKRRFRWIRPIMLPLQWTVAILQFTPLVFGFDAYAAYALALWWLMFAAVVQFIIQVAAATRPESDA